MMLGLPDLLDYMLSFFPDIDECKIGNGGCQQKCINSLGSFRFDQIVFSFIYSATQSHLSTVSVS